LSAPNKKELLVGYNPPSYGAPMGRAPGLQPVELPFYDEDDDDEYIINCNIEIAIRNRWLKIEEQNNTN